MRPNEYGEFIIPAMDDTSIEIDGDGYLKISQTTLDGEVRNVYVPPPIIPTFIAMINAAVAGGEKRVSEATEALPAINRQPV